MSAAYLIKKWINKHQEMKQMKNTIILILLMSLFYLQGMGQTNYPIKIAFSNEATAVPYTVFLTTPIHPTLQVGSQYFYSHGNHHDFYQTANIGYIFHNHLYQGYYLNTGVGYDYKFDFGLKLKSNLEVGFLHTFATQEEYQFKDGEYVSGPDWGNARLMPMLSLGFGFVFKEENTPTSEIFLLYKSWIEYPYSPGFIPLMTHVNLEIGFIKYINWNHEK